MHLLSATHTRDNFLLSHTPCTSFVTIDLKIFSNTHDKINPKWEQQGPGPHPCSGAVLYVYQPAESRPVQTRAHIGKQTHFHNITMLRHHRIPVLIQLAHPVRRKELAVLVQSRHVPVAPNARSLRVSIPQMTLQVVGSAKRCAAFGYPALIFRMIFTLMNGLFMSLFMLLAFKSFLLLSMFVNAARITAGEFILFNNQGTVHTGLGRRGLGLRR